MRGTKYHARKVQTPEGTFDSQKEYRRWCELKLLQRAGKISDLKRQTKFVLIPAQYESAPRFSARTHQRLKDGRKLVERECAYYADFTYQNESGDLVVEDAKGARTPEYIIKRKLMLLVHGIKIEEV